MGIEHWELSIGQIVCFLIRDRICEKLYLVQPHQRGGVVMKHDSNVVRLDPERQQRPNKDSHAVDTVHVQNLAKVTSDDASLGANFLDRADCFHRIGHRLIQARYHGLAVRPYIDSKLSEFLHLLQQQLVQF